MANVGQVISMLCPNVEWSLIGEKYEDIDWHGIAAPITKKQFIDGFAEYDNWKTQQDAIKTQAKSDLLAKLGITAEEAALLLS
jgi:hypothetical protein